MTEKKSGEATPGSVAEINELSARQRMQLFALYKKKMNPIEVQAHVIKMGCPEHSDKSVDKILDLPGQLFDEVSTRILDISGLGADSQAKAEKK